MLAIAVVAPIPRAMVTVMTSVPSRLEGRVIARSACRPSAIRDLANSISRSRFMVLAGAAAGDGDVAPLFAFASLRHLALVRRPPVWRELLRVRPRQIQRVSIVEQ